MREPQCCVDSAETAKAGTCIWTPSDRGPKCKRFAVFCAFRCDTHGRWKLAKSIQSPFHVLRRPVLEPSDPEDAPQQARFMRSARPGSTWLLHRARIGSSSSFAEQLC